MNSLVVSFEASMSAGMSILRRLFGGDVADGMVNVSSKWKHWLVQVN